MKTLRKPFWIFLLVTLPAIVLFFLFGGAYNVIGSLLDEENIYYWKLFGGWLGGMALLFTGYAAYCQFTKKTMHPLLCIFLLAGYVAFIYLYFEKSSAILSWNIPRWMMFQGDLHMYMYTFTMPVLLYAVLLLVDWLTPDVQNTKGWVSFLISLAFPVTWYLLVNVINIFRAYDFEGDGWRHIFTIIFIVSTVLFLFFLLRAIYLLLSKKSELFKKYSLAWKIPLVIVFPLLGLALNNGLFAFQGEGRYLVGIFGDFSSPGFYILAILTGILLCFGSPENIKLRLVLYVARCFSYAFTVYFFLVFVPYFPLSIAAIIAVGLGFLMLTPLAQMLIHSKMLADDRVFLRQHHGKLFLNAVAVAAFAVIPVIISITYYTDRRTLHNALDSLYEPDFSQEQPRIDTVSLNRTLDRVEHNKNDRPNMLAGLTQGTPYLDAYYRWMVLDHLTLSGSKTDMLRRVFCGPGNEDRPRFFSRLNSEKDSLVKIKDQRVSSVYDPAAKLWKTTLDLEIENTDTVSEFRRTYSTVFALPDGCWISDYYLVVGDQKKKGILAEKKAATWVFTEIVRRAQDPGLLRYRDDGKIDFRVFPFVGGEIRRTGITFSHIEPFALDMDSLHLQMGDPAKNNVKGIVSFPGSSLEYVSKEAKQKLKLVTRIPAYYFIVDASSGNSAKMNTYAERIRKFEKENGISAQKDVVVAAANYRVQSWNAGEAWTEGLSGFPCEGGFNLENAMRRLLAEHFSKAGNTGRPVFIVVSNELDKAIYTRPLNDMRFILPESDAYYSLDENARLVPQSINEEPVQQTAQSKQVIVLPPVYEYKDQSGKSHYLPTDSSGCFVFTETKETAEADEGTTLENAMKLESATRNLILHPEQTEAKWLDIVRGSFKTRLLTPYTAYIVVETEAQEKALLEKQKQTMSSKKSLDASEDEFQMSEPSLWILLGLLLVVFLVRRRFAKSRA